MEYRKANRDFLVDGKYIIEVGGEDKGFTQIANFANSYVLSDDLELHDLILHVADDLYRGEVFV